MSRRPPPVPYRLDPRDVRALSPDELKVVLRGADDLIAVGGRHLLAKILKGSRAQDVLAHGLDQSPVYGRFRSMSESDVLARIDRAILDGYLRIEYIGRLPMLVYTAAGWDIEKDGYADELLQGFDARLAEGPPYDMTYLKDRNRALIWCLLDKLEARGDPLHLPLLEAWAQIDYKKVQHRVQEVIQRLRGDPA